MVSVDNEDLDRRMFGPWKNIVKVLFNLVVYIWWWRGAIFEIFEWTMCLALTDFGDLLILNEYL